jgi:hypothetical protein
MGYCPHRREGHMRCGTRDGGTLSRRRRLDPRLLVVRSRRATTEPWAARNGANAARGALLSARCGAVGIRPEIPVAESEQDSRPIPAGFREHLCGGRQRHSRGGECRCWRTEMREPRRPH